MPQQGNPEPDTLVPSENPSVGARISTQRKAALKLTLQHLNERRTAAEGALTETDLIKEALNDWFAANRDRLPEEARDLLDEDLLANAGGTETEADA